MLLLRNLLFTFVVPGSVAVYVPLWIAGDRPMASGGLFALALALYSLGGSVYAWCVWDFASFGRGTPAPIDAPRRLVVRGLYRYVRNPMYVGVLCVILGQAALFRSGDLLVYAAVVATVFHLFVVAYEEPTLADAFPDDYPGYRATVGRWWPRRPGGGS